MMPSQTVADALRPFHALFAAFRDAGFQLYAVGGCVRDWTMGKPPKDIDFTTDALPEQTKDLLAALGMKVIPVGEAFGTVATLLGGKQYEITTFRVRESYTRGSRHPIVCYGKSLEADLERRDLTINAMAADEAGHIHDPFDGLGDIERRLLRVPRSSYEQTLGIFGDDPLRMLRLARFMSRLDFDADEFATRAATDMAGAILTVSHERWFAELDGLLRAAHPGKGIAWLWDSGILPLILPELCALRTCRRMPASLSGAPMPESEADAFAQTVALVESAPADGDFRWAVLLSSLGYPASVDFSWATMTSRMLASEILARFKFSTARNAHVCALLHLLPEGEPCYRAAREFAIELGADLPSWNAFQDVRLAALPAHTRSREAERLARWREALAPYLDAPSSAEIALPQGLSQSLAQHLGVRGKTLGLCIAQCREAVLDQCLTENDGCDAFVAWVRAHFSE